MPRAYIVAGTVISLLAMLQNANAALIGSCTITIGASGTMRVGPQLNTMSSTFAGGQTARATVKPSSLLCSVLSLIDCFSISAPPPASFTSAPNGGSNGVSFASTYRINGGADRSGGTRTAVTNGTHNVDVNLTAEKASGPFAAGDYQAQVTVRCE